MSMTMLEIVQAATGEMGLAVPSSVAGNTSADVVQLLALLNSLGRSLQQEHDWQKLIVQYRFYTAYLQTTGNTTDGSAVVSSIPDTTGLDTTYQAIGEGIPQDCFIVSVDSSTQVTLNQPVQASQTAGEIFFCQMAYDWPADYDRQIDRTQWDKSKHWEMLGPETSQEWQWLVSGYISTGPRIRWRQLDGKFQIWPAVTSNEYLGLEYVSKNWARSAAGTGKYTLTANDDTTIFSDQLMIVGLKMRYFDVKGFDASGFTVEFARLLNIAKAAEVSGRTLSFAPTVSNVLITPQNIPDSGFGQPFQ
jgi:hypothetical protein